MRRKIRIARIILTEIIVMALGVLCCIMPMPWRLVVPIIIGTRSILLTARKKLKEEPLQPESMHTKSVKTKGKSSQAEKKPTANRVVRIKNSKVKALKSNSNTKNTTAKHTKSLSSGSKKQWE